ncbi:MAG: hypothetical protein K0U12_00950 [Gammaproteobacteria bacterium]|nr:hypothetical protein [Gammaproteobacteria bacterium]
MALARRQEWGLLSDALDFQEFNCHEHIPGPKVLKQLINTLRQARQFGLLEKLFLVIAGYREPAHNRPALQAALNAFFEVLPKHCELEPNGIQQLFLSVIMLSYIYGFDIKNEFLSAQALPELVDNFADLLEMEIATDSDVKVGSDTEMMEYDSGSDSDEEKAEVRIFHSYKAGVALKYFRMLDVIVDFQLLKMFKHKIAEDCKNVRQALTEQNPGMLECLLYGSREPSLAPGSKEQVLGKYLTQAEMQQAKAMLASWKLDPKRYEAIEQRLAEEHYQASKARLSGFFAASPAAAATGKPNVTPGGLMTMSGSTFGPTGHK